MKRKELLVGLVVIMMLMVTGCLLKTSPKEDGNDGILFAPSFNSEGDLSGWTSLWGTWALGTGDHTDAVGGVGEETMLYYPGFELPETFEVTVELYMPTRAASEPWWAGLVFYSSQSEIHVVRWKCDGSIQSNIYDASSGAMQMKSPGYSAATLPSIPANQYVVVSIKRSDEGVRISVNGAEPTGSSATFPHLSSLKSGAKIGFYAGVGEQIYFRNLVVKEI